MRPILSVKYINKIAFASFMEPDGCVEKLKDAYKVVQGYVENGHIDRAAVHWSETLTSSTFYLLEGRIEREFHMGTTLVNTVRALTDSLLYDDHSDLEYLMKIMKMTLAQAGLPDGNR